MNSLQINLDPFTQVLTTRVWADLISLRVIMASMGDKTYLKHSNKKTNELTLTAPPPELNQGLIDYEITKAFISMMRNVNDYLDRMISIVLFYRKPFIVPHAMNVNELNTYLNKQLNQELFDYCQRTNERFPDKLSFFKNLPEEFVRYMTVYNQLRNCYEHHKAISKSVLKIPIRKLHIKAKGKDVKIGEPIEGGSPISLSWEEKIIHIEKGAAALLDYEDLEFTAMYLISNVNFEITQQVIRITTDKTT